MKLYMNSDKLNSIENNKLRAIYKDIKEKLIDIIVYMDTINLGNISKGYIEKELNSIILILNQNCKEYFLIKINYIPQIWKEMRSDWFNKLKSCLINLKI